MEKQGKLLNSIIHNMKDDDLIELQELLYSELNFRSNKEKAKQKDTLKVSNFLSRDNKDDIVF